MKTLKPIIFFLSMVSICLPVYSMDSGSGDGASRKFDLIVSTVKKNPGIALAAGLAMSAGLYIYKSAAKSSKNAFPRVELRQVQVASQTPECGGNASCGYQGLKNALYLVMPEASEKDLQDVALVKRLFNKQEPIGLWRKLVLDSSYHRAIKCMFDEHLRSELITEKQLANIEVPALVEVLVSQGKDAHVGVDRFKQKIRNFYQLVLIDELSPQFVEQLEQDLKNEDMYVRRQAIIKKHTLVEAIKKSGRIIESDIEGLKEFNFVEHAKQNDTIASYLPDINNDRALELTVSKKDALSAYNQKNPASPLDVTGDWINENEIALIVESEKKPEGLLSNMPARFDGITIIDNVLLLDKGEGSYQEIKEIADRLEAKPDFVHAFVVGLMNGELGQEQGERHWITLVVIKEDGKTIWEVADSSNNRSRLNDPIIGTLIKHLLKRA